MSSSGTKRSSEGGEDAIAKHLKTETQKPKSETETETETQKPKTVEVGALSYTPAQPEKKLEVRADLRAYKHPMQRGNKRVRARGMWVRCSHVEISGECLGDGRRGLRREEPGVGARLVRPRSPGGGVAVRPRTGATRAGTVVSARGWTIDGF